MLGRYDTGRFLAIVGIFAALILGALLAIYFFSRASCGSAGCASNDLYVLWLSIAGLLLIGCVVLFVFLFIRFGRGFGGLKQDKLDVDGSGR